MSPLPGRPERTPQDPKAMLWFLALAGLALRLWWGRRAAWYWDEGYVAQVAADLGRFVRPRCGALWEDGFFPLTSSWLAPLSAAPFTRLPSLDPLQACRAWAALMGGLSVYLLGRVGWRLAGPAAGLAAAAALALAPPCIQLGGLALYHNLGAVLLLLALGLRLRAPRDAGPSEQRTALLLAGLAWAACYWLWWLPFCLGLSFRPQGWRKVLGAWILGTLPLALTLALQLWLGGEAAQASLQGLFVSARSVQNWSAVAEVLRDQPLVPLGLLGLLWVGPGRRWIALGAALAVADLYRQRGDFNANAYALLPVLPLLCLGLVLLTRDWVQREGKALLLGAAVLALGLGRFQMDDLRRLSLRPESGRTLQEFLLTQSPPGSLVISLPPLDWGLRPLLRCTEPAQVLAAQGWAAGHLREGMPAAAWAELPRFEDARFLLSGWLQHQSLYHYQRMALPALRAELEGWPLVLQGPDYGVYANPRFGYKPARVGRILWFRSAYQQAAADAESLGLRELAAFARRRAADGLPDPPER